MIDPELREHREAVVRNHMESENVHDFDGVIVEFWLKGTHRGALLGIEPTGRTFACRMAAFFLFEERKIVCERVYFDSATILRQLTS